MTKKEAQSKLAAIERTISGFPKIVKQNEIRGKAHRKLMKAFAPMAKDLAKRVRKARNSA